MKEGAYNCAGGSVVQPASAPIVTRDKSVHFSSESGEWATPQWLFDSLDKEFRFTLDPCCTHENAKCKKHYTKKENGLLQSWADERVYMNPPYGRDIKPWMCKAYEEFKNGALVVCLVAARTDTAWWHDYAAKGDVRFYRGRLRFGEAKQSASFPSALVVFRPGQYSYHDLPNRSFATCRKRKASAPRLTQKTVEAISGVVGSTFIHQL